MSEQGGMKYLGRFSACQSELVEIHVTGDFEP